MNNNGGSPPPSPFCCNCGCQSEKGKFPPGYKFNPTDEELVVNYLKNKAMNKPLPHSDIMQNKILEVNLYSHNPEDLAEGYNLGSSSGEKECFFFTPRDRKYRNGNRPNRAAGDGYWKATGVDKAVKSNEVIVGYRRALVFYKGKPPKGDKTSWIMHEYRFNAPARKRMSSNDMRLDDWVLCRIHKKKEPSKPKSKGEEEATESTDVTGEQSVEAAASDENQIHDDDDDDQDMTETDGNIERYTDNDFEQHQYSPLLTYNPYGINQTSPLPPFQGGSLANTPLNHHAHFPQFYEDEQPPPDQVMVQPAFGKRPSMYPQMGPNSNMMFRRQYATESKPTGLVPRQQQQQQHDDEFEFKASLGQLQACLVDEDMSSDHSKDKSPGTSHDLPFNEEYGA